MSEESTGWNPIESLAGQGGVGGLEDLLSAITRHALCPGCKQRILGLLTLARQRSAENLAFVRGQLAGIDEALKLCEEQDVD